ncbi:hypothetical protein LWI28_023578 [Acer negundo]|uniref:Uncharacterized protein n=1 Tax=Acer negundo TaxID=4023 RepID=A0AAD5J7N5_ACENE|nr:hypothetical protein LWI28_023578 [Acer negundo]
MSETAYVAFRNRTLIDSDHVAFGYCYTPYILREQLWRLGRWFRNYSFEFRLSEESPNCRVKSCGVCPIYFQDPDTDDSDEAGTSGSRFDEEEMEPHPKENENLQAVKYAEPIEHIEETIGIRRSRTSNDHMQAVDFIFFQCTYSDGDQSSPTNILLAIACVASRNGTLIDSDHVAFGYRDVSYDWQLGRRFIKSFEIQLSEESPNYRLKSCGVCPIYFQDSDTDDSDEAGTSGSSHIPKRMRICRQ